jgi:hypothetical protein
LHWRVTARIISYSKLYVDLHSRYSSSVMQFAVG